MDDLTRIDGIGKASAKALVDAGIGTFAALAALDPGNPPEITGLRGPEWPAWIGQAQTVLAAEPVPPGQVPAAAKPHVKAQSARRAATAISRIDHDDPCAIANHSFDGFARLRIDDVKRIFTTQA